MKILIIGGTGHIGVWLSAILREEGDDVVALSRGRAPGLAGMDFRKQVKYVTLEYGKSLADGSFLALLGAEKPDVVVDILQGNIRAVLTACRTAQVSHLIACGSLWMLGRPKVVPTPETAFEYCPFPDYQERWTALSQAVAWAQIHGFAFTAILPPNICGPGKIPLDGHGGRSLEVHQAHQRGESVILPYPGTNLIGPCDAEDVARGFFCAIKNREAAAGEIFNVGSVYALTAEKFIGTYADIYGKTIPVRFASPEWYEENVLPDLGARYHFTEHMCPDIAKISSRLGYQPKYTPEETMERAVKWMFDTGLMQ